MSHGKANVAYLSHLKTNNMILPQNIINKVFMIYKFITIK